MPKDSDMARSRDPIALVGTILALGVAIVGGLSSSAWVGNAFPGFLVLENRVIASAGLTHWPAVAGGRIYQHEIVAVDGRNLASSGELRDYVASLPVGSEVVYRLRSEGRERDQTIESRTFTLTDFALLFGSYLVCGLGLTGVAIAVRFLGGRDPAATGSAVARLSTPER